MEAATWEAIEKAEKMFGGKQEAKQETLGIFDVAAYLNYYGIAFNVKNNGSRTIYQLEQCLFDSSHGKDGAVMQSPEGQLGYKCFHDGCQGKGWSQARAKISGNDNLKQFMPGGKQERKDLEEELNLVIVTAGEVDKMIKKFEDPLIDGLLEIGDSLLVSGEGGLGKSLVTLSVGLSVASGKRVFDKFEVTKPQPVLLIQSENSLKATKMRLNALLESLKGRVDFRDYKAGMDNIFMVMSNDDIRVSGDVLNPKFAKVVRDSIEATKAEFLILDPLISYHRQQENDNTGMREALDELTRIVGPKVSVMVSHHHGKGDHTGANQSRGATAITDWARGIITLNRQRHESKNLIKCKHTKAGNFEKAQDFLLEVDGPAVVPVEPDIICPPSRVVEILTEMGGIAESKNSLVKSLCEAADVSRRTALDAINKADDFGFVKVEQRGSAYVYTCLCQ